MKNVLLFLALGITGWLGYQYLQTPTAVEPEAKVEEKPSRCSNPIAVYEDLARLPLRDFVLKEMGALKGKTVLDIGAGPGFFAFEMVKTADQVIVSELDPLFLSYMKEKKKRLGIRNFEIVKASESHTELQNIKTDYALMVYVFHYLDDPKLFLKELTKTLLPGGQLFIANAQLSPVIIRDYLEGAGFDQITEKPFSYPQSGCGDVHLQLISATLSVDHVQATTPFPQ